MRACLGEQFKELIKSIFCDSLDIAKNDYFEINELIKEDNQAVVAVSHLMADLHLKRLHLK
jgi:hypothetical protein